MQRSVQQHVRRLSTSIHGTICLSDLRDQAVCQCTVLMGHEHDASMQQHNFTHESVVAFRRLHRARTSLSAGCSIIRQQQHSSLLCKRASQASNMPFLCPAWMQHKAWTWQKHLMARLPPTCSCHRLRTSSTTSRASQKPRWVHKDGASRGVHMGRWFVWNMSVKPVLNGKNACSAQPHGQVLSISCNRGYTCPAFADSMHHIPISMACNPLQNCRLMLCSREEHHLCHTCLCRLCS